MFTACKKEEEENTNIEQNFLDKYNGVIWHDSSTVINIEWWYYFTPTTFTECEDFMGQSGPDCCDTFNWGEDQISLIENSPNKLVIGFGSAPPDEHTYRTINDGNTLEVTFSFDNSIEYYSRTTTFPCY
tara:strand:- start:46 stop:432 length:387 start_codon:yes stop_codon:yes gene_type:complete